MSTSRTPFYTYRANYSPAPARPPAYTGRGHDKSISSCPPDPSTTPPWPVSPTGPSYRPSMSNLPSEGTSSAHNDRWAAAPSFVDRFSGAGHPSLAVDRTVNDTWDPRGIHRVPGGRPWDSHIRHSEHWGFGEPTMVSTPAPVTPQYRDEMLYSRTGQPANHRWADHRDFVLLEDVSASWADQESDETLQRKRKRENIQEQVTHPDDRPPKKRKQLMDQQHPPELVFSYHPVSPPVPLENASIRQAEGGEYRCSTNMVDQPNAFQGIPEPDILETPKKKRKRTPGVEAGPTKKRKKLDNNQNGATNGGTLDVNGDTPNGSSVFSHNVATPPPVVRSIPWTSPIPTERDKGAGVQVLEPAPATRFTSGGSGKKGPSSVWHVWSEVNNCARTN